MSTLLIRNIGTLLTMAGPPGARGGALQQELGLRHGCAIFIDRGLVAAVGSEADVRALVEDDVAEIDAGGRLVTPGLIDAHTHLVHAGRREGEFEARARGATYHEIMAAGGGIFATVAATRAASLASLVEQAKKHLSAMLAYGTTTCEAKSGYGLDIETELRQLEAVAVLADAQPVELVPTFMGAHAVPPDRSAEEFSDWICRDAMPQVARQGIARFNDVFCEQGVFTPEQSQRILEAGRRYGLLPKIHADELCDTGGAALAARLGAVSADHLHCASEAGLRAMAESGTIAVLLPGTAVFLGLNAHAPARAMVEAGIPVALGTDFNPGSCPCESMPLIMSFACSQLGLTPAETWVAATVNAAYAVGLGGRIGTLEPGMQADLVIWDADDHRTVPYRMGFNAVQTVIKAGQVVHRV